MSAYIVSPKCLKTVVEAIMHAECGKFWHEPMRTTDELNEQANQLAYDLIAMNYRAVNFRYDENNSPDDYKLPKISLVNAPEKNLAYRALGEFTYQCSEGDVPGEELFKRVEEAETRLGHIIAQQVAYGAGGWNTD